MIKIINIGLLGLGTVGTGILEIIDERLSSQLKIKKILVKDKYKMRDKEINKGIITDEFNEILEDPEISIIIEVTSDLEKSYEYIKKSLNKGKHVVTASKAAVSKYFEELSSLGNENNCAFLYEASVGGGIPILKPLKEQITTNEIEKIQGILNGTSNYILTRMFNEGLSYNEVLKIAQELGYAETDPTSDVEGHDALRKLRILGTIGLRGKVEEKDIIARGIKNILAFDIEQIKKLDSTVKLIGEIKSSQDKFTAIVEPTIIKNDSYFAHVNMAFNAISIVGNNVGLLNFHGAGAGKLATANAVISDVLDIAKNSYRNGNPLGEREFENINKDIKGKYYLRVSKEDKNTLNELMQISEKVFSTKEYIAITTNALYLKDVLKLIERIDIKENEYFLAKVMN